MSELDEKGYRNSTMEAGTDNDDYWVLIEYPHQINQDFVCKLVTLEPVNMGKCLSKNAEYKLKNEPSEEEVPYKKSEKKDVESEGDGVPAEADSGGETQTLISPPDGDTKPLQNEPVQVEIESTVQAEQTTVPGDEKDYDDYPFLNDEKTKECIPKFPVLFIMRGLSGSGKSKIADKIEKEYKNVVVCSADHFFMKDGVYVFDGDKLKDAHQICQRNAGAACSEEKLVVIDNTNVRKWELQHYINLAADYNYMVVIVEPKTPWAFEPSVLVQKSIHGVSLGLLEDKVKKYDRVLPVFVGWFLNREGTEKLSDLGKKYFQLCLESYPELRKWLKKSEDEESDKQETEDSTKDFEDYFKRAKGERSTFHCTAFYVGAGKSQIARQYFKKKAVQQSMGKHFPLKIIGIVVTPRTLGARVELDGEQLELWQKDKDATGDKKSDDGKKQKKKEKKEKRKQTKDENDESLGLLNAFEENEHEDEANEQEESDATKVMITVEDVDGGEDGQGHTWKESESPSKPVAAELESPPNSEHAEGHTELRREIVEIQASEEITSIDSSGDGQTSINTLGSYDASGEEPLETHPTSRFHPISGKGSRAHVTLGCHGVEPVQTGLDLLDVVQCEIKMEGNDEHKSVEGAAIRYYEEGRCVVYLDTPIEVPTIFTGFYT